MAHKPQPTEFQDYSHRLNQKYLSKKTKLLLKQQQSEMKSYIKKAKIQKQMQRPLNEVNNIVLTHACKRLEDRRYEILNSMNSKQKEIQNLLLVGRESSFGQNGSWISGDRFENRRY